MTAFYNEIDPFAAQWLRNLIEAGHIALGVVDERSIEDISPEELDGFTQVHFFAGIGGWSLALRMAGWPDDRPVWTGSCPCQPFSSAGKGNGFADERHLWPAFHHLITERRPPVVFGEQVAGKAGRAWLSLVRADLEGVGYAVGAADLSAAGLGAPHIRQRLYWVADSHDQGLEVQRIEPARAERSTSERGGEAGGVADAECKRVRTRGSRSPRSTPTALQNGNGERQRVWIDAGSSDDSMGTPTSPTNGHWRDADWLYCRDARWRPVEPGTFPLAHGVPSRVGRLRAYGNAIVPQVAQAFVEAYLDSESFLELMS